MEPAVRVPAAFLERARREAERYGDDPWILLRELVQNSRDAGASRITFRVQVDESTEVLACEDDGAGMSRDDVTAYLLRLYASGKQSGDGAAARAGGPAGRFGVGFWSVLRFSPSAVRVESSTGGAQVAFEVDCRAGLLREVRCSFVSRGTRVTLLRPRAGEPLEDVVERGLLRWASHVRGTPGGRPPRLSLNGRTLNRRFEAQGYASERLQGPGFEGIVGVGPHPRIRLYAHGLLIREVGSLEELLPRRPPRRALDAPGLHPVADINADGLEVLLDRQQVVEDELLERIVRGCERSLSRLQRSLLDRVAPLPLLERARAALTSRRAVFVAAALAVAGVGVAGGAALRGPPPALASTATTAAAQDLVERAPWGSRRAAQRPVAAAVDGSQGPRINTPPEAGTGWDLRVRGPGRHLVKVATYARYDEERGLVAEPVDVHALYDAPGGTAGPRALLLDLGLSASQEPTVLPVPAGHRVLPGTFTLDGGSIRGLGESAFGEPVLFEPHDGGRASYLAVPVRPRRERRPPPVGGTPERLPWTLQALVDEVRDLPAGARAAALTRAVSRHVRYTTAADDSARFDALSGSFVERVAALRAGDCDVMNALNVLLLRKAAVPARLAVGFVVEDGRVAPELHAWTEYYDDGWRVLDASPVRPEPAAARAGPAEPTAAPRAASARHLGDAPVASPRHSRATAWPWVLLLGGLALTSAAGAGLVARALRDRRRALDGGREDEALVRMLRQFLKQRSEADPLLLRRRPFFPSVAGGALSLAELERLSERGRLLVGTAASDLCDLIAGGVPVLDGADPRIAALKDRLPPFTDLDELAFLASRRAREPALSAVEAELRRIDPGVRVHAVPGTRQVLEVELPVKKGALAPRHLLVGLEAPEVRALLARFPHAPRLVTFELSRLLLERTTLYAGVRDALLVPLAEGAVSEAAA